MWWLVLSVGVGLAHSKLSPVVLRWVNGASGALVLAFGVVSLVGLLGGPWPSVAYVATNPIPSHLVVPSVYRAGPGP